MKKITAKPISSQNWILTEWGTRIGVLTKTNDIWSIIEAGSLSEYKTIDDLCKDKKWSLIFEEKDIKEISTSKIDKVGKFPIKHDDPQNIELTPIPSYTKTKISSIRFAAGYWGIKFSNGWSPSFCPKLETVTSNESVGPFTSKVEMNTVIAQKNKKD